MWILESKYIGKYFSFASKKIHICLKKLKIEKKPTKDERSYFEWHDQHKRAPYIKRYTDKMLTDNRIQTNAERT